MVIGMHLLFNRYVGRGAASRWSMKSTDLVSRLARSFAVPAEKPSATEVGSLVQKTDSRSFGYPPDSRSIHATASVVWRP